MGYAHLLDNRLVCAGMRDFETSIHLPILSDKPHLPATPMTQIQVQAEMEVEEAAMREIEQRKASFASAQPGRAEGAQSPSSGGPAKAVLTPPNMSAGTHPESSSSFPFDFPGPSTGAATGVQTPVRRRPGAPGAIPNFASAMTPRDPQTYPSSPYSPPERPAMQLTSPSGGFSNFTLPSQPFGSSSSPMVSPWISLAAASGAPTPSIDGPGRNSPHLGYPFERLNISGSWSGANLAGEGLTGGQKRSFDMGGMDVDPSSSGSPYDRKMSADSSHVGSPSSLSTSPSQRPPLPAALAKRRASLPRNILSGGLTASSVHVSKAPSPLATDPSTPSPSAGLQPLSARKLSPLVQQPSTLILDLRPPSIFRQSHIPQSHSIPVPSTLLRRPAFTIEKLAGMLTPQGKAAVDAWREKSYIILLDGNSTDVPAQSTLAGLANKFEREGFKGHLCFVRGGYASVEETGMNLATEDDEEETSSSAPSSGGFMAGRLGKLAFQQGSTGSSLQQAFGHGSMTVPTPGLRLQGDPFSSAPSTTSNTVRPSLASTGSSRSSNSVSRLKNQMESLGENRAAKFQPANPFFDNIRQNLELSHGGGREVIPLSLPPEVSSRSSEFPSWLAELAYLPEKEVSERLADEFYKIELGEQKRLQAIMDWHSSSSGAVVMREVEDQRTADRRGAEKLSQWAEDKEEGDDYFPYSITAGIEQGSKNR